MSPMHVTLKAGVKDTFQMLIFLKAFKGSWDKAERVLFRAV